MGVKSNLLGLSVATSSDGYLIRMRSYDVDPFIRDHSSMLFLGIIPIVDLYLAGIGEDYI